LLYTSKSSEAKISEIINSIQALQNGSKAHQVQADLRDLEAPARIVAEAKSTFYTNEERSETPKFIDILVNNAGCEVVKPLGKITPDDFSYVYNLNVRAPVLLANAVVPHLRQSGRIINISSVGARSGFANLSLYTSSKVALEGFTRSWAAELGNDGITVNCVNPGPVQTDLLDGIPKEIVEMQKANTPVEKRLGTVDDIAQIVAFLAEERSRWISGQVISASGGWSMW
jgi:3-oxoacyl-[acyl-carrier protein] reductase